MDLTIPPASLVVLIGPSGSGKTTFARRHFSPTEVLSSDEFRAMIADDPGDQTVTREAFQVLHLVARKRLAGGRVTVIDATNVQPQARRPLLRIARELARPTVAVVFDLPGEICLRWDRARTGRRVGREVIAQQLSWLARSLPLLVDEGFDRVFLLASPDHLAAARILREPPAAGDR